MNKDVIRINNIRIKNVTQNNEKVYNELINKNIDISLPNHKQFCLIFLGNKDYELDELKQKIIDFCNSLSNEMPICHAVSFGFDYIAIDCYQNFIDNTFKIRVCMSDLPDKLIKKFCNSIYNFLNKL